MCSLALRPGRRANDQEKKMRKREREKEGNRSKNEKREMDVYTFSLIIRIEPFKQIYICILNEKPLKILNSISHDYVKFYDHELHLFMRSLFVYILSSVKLSYLKFVIDSFRFVFWIKDIEEFFYLSNEMIY